MLGLGATDMHGQGSSTTKFSFNVDGGQVFRLPASRFPFAGKPRPRPTRTRRAAGCSATGGVTAGLSPNDHFLNQGDVTAGVILRF